VLHAPYEEEDCRDCVVVLLEHCECTFLDCLPIYGTF
jgi:hypothetical protein